MSSFILSYAHRVNVTPYAKDGTLQPGSMITLQSTECSPDKELNDIDVTNSESNGFAEFAPTYVVTMFTVNGYVDGTNAFDMVFTTQMDGKLLVKLDFYLTKPVVGPPANNPMIYTATKALVKKCTLTDTPKEGALRMSMQVRVVGQLTKAGTDLTTFAGYTVPF